MATTFSLPDGLPHRGHVPALLAEILEHLAPRSGAVYLDGTFGAGGVSRALLDRAPCRVLALDRDPEAAGPAEALARRAGGRFRFLRARFGDLAASARTLGSPRIDGGIVLDLGVSSRQLDDPARGFSFRHDGPLDMRMDREGGSAADLVNAGAEADLARLIRDYGEERHARRIARAIVAERERAPLTRTLALADLVRRVVPGRPGGRDPATRTFQALRIAVNDELGELRRALRDAERILVRGARLVVVSFHSLEDRIVKRFLAARSGRTPRPPRTLPEAPRSEPSFRLLARRPRRPSGAEVDANPRARSARLRAAERTGAPAHPETA